MTKAQLVNALLEKTGLLNGQNKKIRKRVQGIEKILLKGQT